MCLLCPIVMKSQITVLPGRRPPCESKPDCAGYAGIFSYAWLHLLQRRVCCWLFVAHERNFMTHSSWAARCFPLSMGDVSRQKQQFPFPETPHRAKTRYGDEQGSWKIFLVKWIFFVVTLQAPPLPPNESVVSGAQSNSSLVCGTFQTLSHSCVEGAASLTTGVELGAELMHLTSSKVWETLTCRNVL